MVKEGAMKLSRKEFFKQKCVKYGRNCGRGLLEIFREHMHQKQCGCGDVSKRNSCKQYQKELWL